MKIKQRINLKAFVFFLLNILCIHEISAKESSSQNANIRIEKQNPTIEHFIGQVEEQTNYLFIYSKNEINPKASVCINSGKKTVKSCLNEAFKNSDIKYAFENDYIVLTRNVPTTIARQSEKNIRGVVQDENGIPVIGANIIEKGTTNGVITDIDGKFTLKVSENAILLISYIGYVPQEISVKDNTVFTITMFEETQILDEVVVTALGIKREEKALGYSVQKVDGAELTNVKGVDIGTSLTGKIAGVNVRNSTEFNTAPTILIRGESPLIVIDGVSYGNIGLSEIAPDDIEEISILKGSTASALYGYRGQAGAIMITTKRGSKEGLNISVNSNTMFHAGYLKLPKPQTSYSTGTGSRYDREDYVWGDKMDIGRTAVQYDPYTYEWREMPLVSKGKNNFENFLENSFITNNNVNVTYKGQNGSFRTSLTHVYNKGQYPNLKLNRFTYTVAGDTKIGKFSIDGSSTYNKRYFPQNRGAGYGATGYIYNFLVWTGTDYDIREYRNYWVEGRENETQNYWNPGWYDNPYFIAYERTHSSSNDRFNGHLNTTYEATDWLNAVARVGVDYYSVRSESKTPLSTKGNRKGAYSLSNSRGHSINGDLMAMADYKIGDFDIEGLFGGSIYFYEDDAHSSSTANGLTIPGYYSLKASVDPATTSSTVSKRQVNSLYGKFGLSWKSTVFAEFTGRNDWSSTLDISEQSYFYPSASASVILSELFPDIPLVDFWKIRGSWTVTKLPPGVYTINQTYNITTNVWDNKLGASYPTTIRSSTIKPETTRSFELGTAFHFWNNRLRFDLAYYQKLRYNIQRSAGVSQASGFSSTLVNIGEEQLRKGVEITLATEIFKTDDFKWTATVNWALDRYYYHKIDPEYSTDRPWVAPGERWDWMGGVRDWQRDSEGNIIHLNGKPQLMKYDRDGFNEFPDWIWGFTNDFKYKNFNLSFTFDGRVGGYAYNMVQQAMWHSGTHPDSDNQWRYDEVVNGKKNYIGEGVKVVSGDVTYDSYGRITEDTRVFAPNDVAISYEEYTRSYQSWAGYSAKKIQNIEKMTFFKLREMTFGYAFPKMVCEKLKINDAHIALVGQNLFLWTKDFEFSDPDASSENLNSPSVRYIGVNLKFNF